MIVADSTNLIRFVRGYWMYLAAVVIVMIGVEIISDYIDFERPSSASAKPTHVGGKPEAIGDSSSMTAGASRDRSSVWSPISRHTLEWCIVISRG